jgi:multidrug transporter EmrE-like cation transporter
MNPVKIIGIVLIVGGVLGLAVGGFSYTKETHKASLGPIAFSVQEKETVNVPLWASIAAIVAGAGVLVMGTRKA